ncbi:ATP-dependent acyl-CoA ligase [Paracoccus fontiphilus]|uniref:ATP-dependent acyl-CoA ligase n=1 Tax=Paracoccus fontiphilus TaxID=1815556 RepID=A0ABV7IFP6_9RHOB|nr:ATP-dependent acyl-CoA ligase [Paracoccus fontiphilus]
MTSQHSTFLPEHDLLEPARARAYCAASHARADALEAEVAPACRHFPALLRRRMDAAPDLPLVRIGDRHLTAAQLCDNAARWGGMLTGAGVARHDRVAMLCGNRIEFLELLAAIGWIGAVSVPINTASRGLQLQHILQNSGARVLIIERALLEGLSTIDRTGLPLETVWVLDADGDDLPAGTAPLPQPGQPVDCADVRTSDAFSILYTSGTTGLSKGVICPHGQFFWWAITTGRQLGIEPGDVLHTTLPLFHTNALNCFFQALVFGATQSLSERFSVSRYYDQLRASDATVTYLLGAMVPMLLSRDASPAERDHKTRIALAPGVPGHFHAEFTRRTGILLLDAFGSTETNNVIQTEADSVNPGFMGRVAKGFAARVVDQDDFPVPDGMPGELLLRADEPYAFASGYLGMAEATVETWRNLWVHTGDRVVREADGSFRFVDRIKETIRRRGENISSFEVEQGVLSHPAVATAAAYPVRSELAEDEVMVAVVLKDGAMLDPADLIRHCETRMPYFAVPRFVDLRTDLPRTENGKVQKFKLREEGVTDTAWDREAAGLSVRR